MENPPPLQQEKPTTIQAVIFDLDGTLLDTEFLCGQGIQRVLTHLDGKSQLSWPLRKKLLGKCTKDWTQLVLSELQLSHLVTWQEFARRFETEMTSIYPQAQLMPGAHHILQLLMGSVKVPVAIATSSSSHAFPFKRQADPQFFDSFDLVVCGDDEQVAHGKPAPDIFLAAAKRLGVNDFSRVLVFEDTINGIRAGKAAGMQVVAIPDERLYATPEERAPFQEADQIISSLEAFDASTWNFVGSE